MKRVLILFGFLAVFAALLQPCQADELMGQRFRIERAPWNPKLMTGDYYRCQPEFSETLYFNEDSNYAGLNCFMTNLPEGYERWNDYFQFWTNVPGLEDYMINSEWCNEGIDLAEACSQLCASACLNNVLIMVSASWSEIQTGNGIDWVCDCTCLENLRFRDPCSLKWRPPRPPWCTTYNCPPECNDFCPEPDPDDCPPNECIAGCPGWPHCVHPSCEPDDCWKHCCNYTSGCSTPCD